MNISTTGLQLASDAAIDLHLHTLYSDGDWTLEALFDHLLGEGFSLAAITDHDTVEMAVAIQQLALEKKLPALVGVEMTTTWQGEMVDLLCYGFDPEQSALKGLAQDLYRRQQENTRQVYEAIQSQGYPLPPETVSDLLAQPSSRQPHAFVAALKAQGYTFGDSPLGKIFLEKIAFATNEPAAVVEAAHQDGAVCLLAHPGQKDGYVSFDVPLLDQFRREAPVDGLEVYHPAHEPRRAEMYEEYALRHRLLISAGSDSHRPEKPPMKYPAESCRDLLERLGIQVG